LQDSAKFPQNWDFWFESIPSGNPEINLFAVHENVKNGLLIEAPSGKRASR
jgi:hypothetical protein